MEQKICDTCFAEMRAEDQVCMQCGCEQKNHTEFPMALPVGTILGGRYILGRVLGQGGFGITYLAQDYQTKERVAVKEYFPDTMATRNHTRAVTAYTGTREENFAYGKQCFLEEARTLAAFQGNPNIVGIYNYFEENNTAYFVMEYLAGQSLDQYVADHGGRLSWEEALGLLLPIMEALDSVHGRGIIHRDVTPDNICILPDGKVKLLDFGSARYSLGDRSRSLDVVLKHGFAPKEQYSRHGRQGPFTDVYSLAATLYYVLTGRKPPESIDRMEEDDLVLPSSLGVKLPIFGEDALVKALAVQPTDRFQSAGAFAQALQGNGESREDGSQKQTGSAVVLETAASEPGSIPRKKRLTVLIPAAIVILAVLVSLPMVIFGGSQKKSMYEQAMKLYIAGQYSQAMELFSTLEHYRDSGEMVLLCSDQLLEEAYAAATELMANGIYEEAIAAFSLLDGYKDSAERIENCEIKMLESRYEEALAFMELGDYGIAASIFADLGHYKDSAERLADCLDAMDAMKISGSNDAQITLGLKGTVNIGDYVTLGTYEQDNDISNGKEPIAWRVLDQQDGRILVVSKYALDCRQYHNVDRGRTAWSGSSIRKWLNNDFLQAAFTENEQAMIPTVTIENPDNPRHGTEGGKATEDQIFLLSAAEATRYFTSDSDRQCEYTAYAVACGITNYNNGCAWWWLRTPGVHENTASGVYNTGEITLGGDYVSCGTDAVRPAMWINLQNAS